MHIYRVLHQTLKPKYDQHKERKSALSKIILTPTCTVNSNTERIGRDLVEEQGEEESVNVKYEFRFNYFFYLQPYITVPIDHYIL
jgi:hypothetical protein